MATIKLPEFKTKDISDTYKPRYKATQTSGLFTETTQPTPFNLFGEPEQQEPVLSETDKRIQDLERQVNNLETRLKEAGATDEDARSGIEKFFNLPAGQVWWMDIFEVIDRPLQTLKYGIAEGSFSEAWEAWKGNREYMSGSEFLLSIGAIDESTLKYNKGLQLFLDIGVDVFADPLNYISPVKFLKKIGLLSDTKLVTKFDEVTKVLRKEGLLQLTDEAITASLTNARKAAEQALRGAGKTTQEIAEILGKNIDQWDDVARNAFNASLEAAGVLDDAGFERMLNTFGQTLDDNGRVVFQVDNAATVRKNARKFVDDVQKLFKDKKITTLKQAKKALSKFVADAEPAIRTRVQAFARANNLNFDDAYRVLTTGEISQGMEIVLDRTFDELQEAVRQLENIKGLDATADATADALEKLPRAKAGEVMEEDVTSRTRQLFQDKADTVFDDVYAVAGDPRGKASDVVFWVKHKDSGRYVQMRNRSGTVFKFEVKDPKKFSILNTNLRTVTKDTIDEGARKLRVKDFRNSKAGQKFYREWLEDVAIFRASNGNPTLAISRGGQLAKLPEDVFIKYADTFRRMMADISGANPKYTVTQYFQFLDDYYKALDKFAGQGKKGKELIRLAEEAARQGKNYPPELIRTITLNASTDAGQQASRELLKLKSMTNTNNAYGMVIKNSKGVDELLILKPDDFFKYSSFNSISIEASQKGASAGKITGKQTKLALYMDVKYANVPEEVAGNGWFLEEIKGVDEVIERVPRVAEEYKAGLIVNILNGISKTRIPFVAPAAEFVAKTVDGLTFLFNSTKRLPNDLTEFLAKIPAEDLQAAKVSIGKVDRLVKDMVRATRGRYKEEFIRSTLQTLLEEGWDGVTVAGRRMTFSEVAKRWALQYRKAGKAQFVNFTDIDFRNFEDVLKRILRQEGQAADFIRLRKIDGATIVEFADGVTAKELDEFVKGLNLEVANRTIDLGKAPLTSEQLVFAKEFNETIQKIVEESVGQQNLLRKLGFNFTEGTLGTGSYFRHSINPEMLKFLRTKSPASIKKFLDAGTDMLRDRTYMGNISEINAAVKEMFGININIFSTDAAYNFADLVRVASTKNEMQTVLQALLKSQDNLGKPLFEVMDDVELKVRGMRRNFQILNNSFKAEFPNLFKNLSDDAQDMLLKYFDDLGFAEGSKVIAIQKSAFGVLKRLDNAYIQLPEFIKNYDQFMKFWKTFALITPGYHMRNLFGNITNSFIAGMPIHKQAIYMFRTSSDFTNYALVLRKLKKGEDITKLPKFMQDAFKRVDDYFRSGASQSHRGVRDLEIIKDGMRLAKGQKRNPAQKLGDALLNANYKIAEMADDMQRYSLYTWAYDNAANSARVKAARKIGASANEIDALRRSEAYRKVSEALFDYSHLTPFEQEYMKRLFPFYTFFKNNLIFQAKSLFERPQQFGKLYRTYKYYTEDMTGMDLEDLPNYMTDNLWLPLPYKVTKGDKEAIEWLRLNLPPSDFTEFVENPFARGVTSLTVPIKFFIELGTNRDLFTGQQIREFPGQKSIYREEGFLKEFRDERGRFTLSQDPYMIKFLNDIGLRSIFNYGTAVIDIIDYRQGNITRAEMTAKIKDALGLTRQQTLTDLEIASLYQNLDRARDLKDLYEQVNDGKLPTLSEIAQMLEQEKLQSPQGIFDNLFS